MRIQRLAIIVLFGLLANASLAFAQTARTDWATVAPPSFVSILPKEGDPARIVVSFTFDISAEGADKAVVAMTDESGKTLDSKLIGRSKKEIKTAEFAPASSGTYGFKITGTRNGVADEKASGTESFSFVYPLAAPTVGARNVGKGALLVSWNSVLEADGYVVSYRDAKTGTEKVAATIVASSATAALETTVSGLAIGEKYGVTVTATRGGERVPSLPFTKTARDGIDRVWNFTWFGQSSKDTLNTMEMLDGDNLKFKLNSCTFDPKTKQIIEKGGKFTTFHDGVSFYYTEIDPKTENFSLTATFTVDYINITADGQEGFGLVAMDSLGERGVSMKNHYTNSASIIATKFEETINGVKKTSKDTVGARFVSGITKEVIAQGDTGIAKSGVNTSKAFSYDQTDLVRAGDKYTLTLKKTNTGYHAILAKQYAAEDAVTEYVMYGPEKLLALDPERIYLGFAVARGCNVTVSDVVLDITDPKTDPAAEKEPAVPVPLAARVDSPSTFTETDYPFTFAANADGVLNVRDAYGKTILKDAAVTHDRDFTAIFSLKKGINDYIVTFAPDPNFRPGEGQVLAAYDSELKKYVESYRPVSITHSIVCLSYDLPELHAAPNGNALGKGTADDPLDIASAIGYAKAGQPVILAGGTYYPRRGITIERGNNGTAETRKIIRSAPGERAVINFSDATSGMILAGNYWTIEGIDVCRTVGNVKGLQISGNDNVVAGVNAYNCGDTGIQISGAGADPFEKWPKNNQVINCTSHDNCDPAQNNADGFAAKLTCGNGNSFRGCISYSNIDDGWDLFSKIETGPIGAVLIEGCVAYRNGSLSDGSGNGDGNGFKLGGDGIAVAHVLRNCIAFANGASGITSNSDPAIVLENNTSYGNSGANVNLYGKGDGARQFRVTGTISMAGGAGDVYREMPELASPNNYFWNGAKCVNSEGKELKADVFAVADAKVIPGRRADGSIDMKGAFTLGDKAPVGVGSSLR